jgi:hypothetical protein
MGNKRLPTILGLFSVIGLLAGLSFLQRRGIIFSQASEEIAPEEVRISNITDNSFVVSWLTSQDATGLIKIKDTEGRERLFLDVRDQLVTASRHQTHYVEVEGLRSDTSYTLTIVSQGRDYQQDKKGKTASPFLGNLPKANLASGRIETPQGEPAQGAIVYVNISGISLLSSIVTSQGNWVVPFAKAFSSDLTQLADYQEGRIIEEIDVQGVDLGTAAAIVYTQNDDPVPVIILGSQYDFTQNGASQAVLPTATQSPDSKLSEFETGVVETEFDILNPEDGETVGFPRPEIFGVGPEGGKVEIKLESPVKYEAELEIDQSNEWQWAPPQDLSAGSHTLTVSYTDPVTGEKETFIRNFVLAASLDDEEPFFSATPSATIAPTLTNTPVPTPTATNTPPPRTSQPSTESGVPEPGFWQPTTIFVGGSLVLFLSLLLL